MVWEQGMVLQEKEPTVFSGWDQVPKIKQKIILARTFLFKDKERISQ